MASTAGPQEGRSARTIALTGPYLAGKTALLEAILSRTGAGPRRSVADKSGAGDISGAENREHGMGVALSVAGTTFLGDSFTFLDCPGSIEFQHEGSVALTACDAAVVVCEPDVRRLPALQLLMRQLEDRGIPHFLFLNKIDTFTSPVRDILPLLQPASRKPLVLRQMPLWEKGIVTGFVDLALNRAYVYREHAPSEIIERPDTIGESGKAARFHMLEQLADYDDELMEQLLLDMEPPQDRIFDDLARDLRDGLICPVLLGSAQNGNGILRLLKALRHEAPFVDKTAERLGIEKGRTAAYVFKTVHTAHGGKLSHVRVLSGEIPDGATVFAGPGREARIAGISGIRGGETVKQAAARAGDTVAFGRLEGLRTGDTLTLDKAGTFHIAGPEAPVPVFAAGLGLRDRKDEMKLSTALAKLIEEDPSLAVEQNPDTRQLLLLGQGEMHMRVAVERLARKFGVAVQRERRLVAYKETIREGTEVRGRHKKQSGGHGQFGDVVIEISPLPRGAGFTFAETITGGAIPRQYIPSVEAGIRDALRAGPLGFPVVDVAVTLKDGSYHTVDSSDMAFRQAGRLAMNEGLPKCAPVLLEPVMAVEIAVPSEATSRVTGLIPQRRGHMQGFDARPGWPGWDVITAEIPAAEMDGLIVELRSATAGMGTFTSRFDHLAEVTGRLAEQVLAAHSQPAV